MGVGGSSLRPLSPLFGADEEGRRGPTLGSVLYPSSEANSWRVAVASPLRIQVFDAHTGKAIALDGSVASALQEHAPFTAFCVAEDPGLASAGGTAGTSGEVSNQQRQLVVGCQDGTVLVFALTRGSLSGPLLEFKGCGESTKTQMFVAGRLYQDIVDSPSENGSGNLAASITALTLGGDVLFTGSAGRCFCWDLTSGKLQREFPLPAGRSGQSSTPSALCSARMPPVASLPEAAFRQRAEGSEPDVEQHCLWVGLDGGNIAVFDVNTGVLTRSFNCGGQEAVMSLAYFPHHTVVFALSAHRRVSVWDSSSYACLQKYPAELMTCGADLSAMISVDLRAMELSLILLAGVDGSLCIRRVNRRADGKLNCVLLSYMENVSGDAGCPITYISYHPATDSMLVGDAGCTVALVGKLRDQLSHAVTAPSPGAHITAQTTGCAPGASAAGAGTTLALAGTAGAASAVGAAATATAAARAVAAATGSEVGSNTLPRTYAAEEGVHGERRGQADTARASLASTEIEGPEEEGGDDGEEEEDEHGEEEEEDEEEDGEEDEEEDPEAAGFPVFQGS